jgi:hypothetical protein
VIVGDVLPGGIFLSRKAIAHAQRERGDSMEFEMALLKQQPTDQKLDQLSKALFEMLEKLRESASAFAEQEAQMEKRIRLLETRKA